MRTPLRTVRGLGSAKSGTTAFWRQRLTAVANIPLILFLIVLIVSLAGADHAAVVARLGSPIIAVLTVAAIISVAVHMRIGMQVIIEDYIHSDGTKVALIIANTLFTVLVALIGIWSVLTISLGG